MKLRVKDIKDLIKEAKNGWFDGIMDHLISAEFDVEKSKIQVVIHTTELFLALER